MNGDVPRAGRGRDLDRLHGAMYRVADAASAATLKVELEDSSDLVMKPR